MKKQKVRIQDFYIRSLNFNISLIDFVNNHNKDIDYETHVSTLFIDFDHSSTGRSKKLVVRYRKNFKDITGRVFVKDKKIIGTYLSKDIVREVKAFLKDKECTWIVLNTSVRIIEGVTFPVEKTIPVGKYKGVNIDHLEELDSDYFQWFKKLVVKKKYEEFSFHPEFVEYTYNAYCKPVFKNGKNEIKGSDSEILVRILRLECTDETKVVMLCRELHLTPKMARLYVINQKSIAAI
jgi:hypothetical protein